MTPAKQAAGGGAHVALLRGVNVGGKNRVAMGPLAALFEEAGCRDVRTFIQSGNVVFRAPAALLGRLPLVIERGLADRYHVRSPVLTRSASELASIARRSPFLGPESDPRTLHVVFLAGRPTRAQVASLDPNRSPADTFIVRGREIYLSCPKGVGQSKLTAAYFDSRLETISTSRNWNTVLSLVELLRAIA